MTLHKPALESIPLSLGLQWRGGISSGYLYQEKSDGRHEFASIAGGMFNAERMASGELVVNDMLSLDGHDMRGESTAVRWGELVRFSAFFANSVRLCRVGQGGEFLEAILSIGGEGVVAKPLDAPFGCNWHKCKRATVAICRILSLDHARGSAELADAATGQPRGKLPLRSRFGLVRVGSVLKVEAFGVTERGMLREARLDRDTPTSWLVQW
jgi:ATP-dependent DNA ligase